MKQKITILKRIILFISYLIPVFGWMIPLYFAPKNETMQSHGRQGFILTMIFIINIVFYFLISRLIPIQYKKIEILIWALIIGIYALTILFFAFLVLFRAKEKLPVIGRLSDKLAL